MLSEASSTLLPLYVCRASLRFLSPHENSPNDTNEMSGNIIRNQPIKQHQQQQQQQKDEQEDSWSSYCWVIGDFLFPQQCLFHTFLLFYFNKNTLIQDGILYFNLSEVLNLGNLCIRIILGKFENTKYHVILQVMNLKWWISGIAILKIVLGDSEVDNS